MSRRRSSGCAPDRPAPGRGRAAVAALLALGALCAAPGCARAVAACGAAAGRICTAAGTGRSGIAADGTPAAEADLYLPLDVTVGPDGRPYVIDWNNHRVVVIDADDRVRVVLRNGQLGDGLDGAAPFAPTPALEHRLNHPTDLLFDAEGRMLVAAWHNSKVRAVGPDGTIRTFAGRCGVRGFDGDKGPAAEARLDRPYGIAVDPRGDVWIADTHNHRVRRVRRAAPGGP